MEKAEAEAPPAAPPAEPPAAPPAAPVLPGDAERDTCPCRRGGVWSSRSHWQMILVVMS